MIERQTLHILSGDSRARAEQARIAFALGHHAEVYAELDELIDRLPGDGIVIATETGEAGMVHDLLERLGECGISIPVVIVSSEPETEQVVAAIKAGALDYLPLPLEMGNFAERLVSILAEGAQKSERRRREINAQRAIATLSRREHEVLELLSAGCSNKEIAQNLGISPRTVEIHRGNMMTKLHAGHAADAVRLWIDANLDIPALPPVDEAGVAEMDEGIAGRIGAKLGERRAIERDLARRRQRVG